MTKRKEKRVVTPMTREEASVIIERIRQIFAFNWATPPTTEEVDRLLVCLALIKTYGIQKDAAGEIGITSREMSYKVTTVHKAHNLEGLIVAIKRGRVRLGVVEPEPVPADLKPETVNPEAMAPAPPTFAELANRAMRSTPTSDDADRLARVQLGLDQ